MVITKNNNTNNDEISPFDKCTKNMKLKLNETRIKNIVNETIHQILEGSGYYPAGADDDPRAPWNDASCEGEKTVLCTAIYYNEETDEVKEVPFDITVVVSGKYETDCDEDGCYNYFVADENNDYEELVRDSGEIPETLDDGYVLDDIEIDGVE